MELSPEQRERLCGALVGAFLSATLLESDLLSGLGLSLDAETSENLGLRTRVFQLLKHAEAHGKIEDIIRGASRARPKNATFRKLAAELGLAPQEPDDLEALLQQRDALRASGAPTGDVDTKISEAKRALREGPRLRADEYLGEYRLLRELGHGGFATVWLAYDRAGRRQVAVKVLHGQWTQSDERIARFNRGAEALRRLQHPHVVRIERACEEEHGFHYFVMEYVPGGTLREAVLAKRLTPAAALGVVASVGDALAYAHAEGVVHRDVKPANVLLRGDGSAVLTDFDLALLGDSTGGTKTGALGTYLFIAPEIAQDARNADARSDVFSLGVTALFVALGRDPTLKERVNHDAALAKTSCSAAVQSVIATAMAEEPADRFQTAQAFVTALRAAMAEPEGRNDGAPDEVPLRAPASSSAPPTPVPQVLPPRPVTEEVSLPGIPAGFTAPMQVVPLPAQQPASLPPVVAQAATTAPVRAPVGGRRLAAAGVVVASVVAVAAWGLMRRGSTPAATEDAGARASNVVVPPAPRASDAAVAPLALALPAPPGREPCPADMALIRGGTFQMGSPDNEGDSDEHPRHAVTLPSYCIDRVETSVSAYRVCVQGQGCSEPLVTGISGYCNWGVQGREDHPVNCLDWSQARAYCMWSGHAGGPRRLPREAEWEFAARGASGRRYPWGFDEPDGTRANLCGNECPGHVAGFAWSDAFATTAPVSSLTRGATPEGVRNLAGNVWEWVEDVYASDAYAHHDETGFYARGATGGSQGTERRVIRGGSWGDGQASVARSAVRYRSVPAFRIYSVGVRCARGVMEQSVNP